MHRTRDVLCPVKAWAHICSEIRSMHSGDKGAGVNSFKGPGGLMVVKWAAFTRCTVRQTLDAPSFGTHSVRCGADLAMYLNVTSIVNIMLQGRWSSNAFIVYITQKILQRSMGISKDMIKTNNLSLVLGRSNIAPLHRTQTGLAFRSSREGSLATSWNLPLAH